MAGKDKSGEQYGDVVQRLQAIVEQLEGGGLSLEDSLEKFAEGIQLVRKGERLLSDAEKRIEQLLSDDSGTKVAPLELKQTEGGKATAQPSQSPQAPGRKAAPEDEEDDVPF